MWQALCMVATLTYGTDKWLSNSCVLRLSREGAGNRNPWTPDSSTILTSNSVFLEHNPPRHSHPPPKSALQTEQWKYPDFSQDLKLLGLPYGKGSSELPGCPYPLPHRQPPKSPSKGDKKLWGDCGLLNTLYPSIACSDGFCSTTTLNSAHCSHQPLYAFGYELINKSPRVNQPWTQVRAKHLTQSWETAVTTEQLTPPAVTMGYTGQGNTDAYTTSTQLATWKRSGLVSSPQQNSTEANAPSALYLSCPSSLLIQLQVLFGQSCIFTLYLLQLDLLSRKSRCYYTTALRVTPPNHFAEQLRCSCWLTA